MHRSRFPRLTALLLTLTLLFTLSACSDSDDAMDTAKDWGDKAKDTAKDWGGKASDTAKDWGSKAADKAKDLKDDVMDD